MGGAHGGNQAREEDRCYRQQRNSAATKIAHLHQVTGRPRTFSVRFQRSGVRMWTEVLMLIFSASPDME